MHGPAIRSEKIFFRVHLTTKTEFVTSASQRPGFVAHLTLSRLTRKTEFVTPAFAGAGVEQPSPPGSFVYKSLVKYLSDKVLFRSLFLDGSSC